MTAPNPSAGEPYTITWRQNAACRGLDTALWYPDRGASNAGGAAARQVCNSCPVRVECLNEPIDNNELYGWWGGTSPKQRRTLRRDAA